MNIAVEISMYPLNEDYEPPILDFIERLNQHADLRIETNSMSTQIRGEYDKVMQALQQEMRTSMEQGETQIFVTKFLASPPVK